VTRPLTRPTAAVGTTFQLGVLAVGVSCADIGTHGCVACSQCLRRTRSWPDDVDLIEEVTAFAACRHLARLLSVKATSTI